MATITRRCCCCLLPLLKPSRHRKLLLLLLPLLLLPCNACDGLRALHCNCNAAKGCCAATAAAQSCMAGPLCRLLREKRLCVAQVNR